MRNMTDWTTGVPDNGNEWRKFRAVPRSYPLRSLVSTLFNRGGNKDRKSGENPIFELSFPIFRAGPISGPISFPILGRRPKTYFLAGRLGRNSKGYFSLENSFPFPSEWTVFPRNEGLGKKELLRLEGKSGRPRFGSVTVRVERFERFRFSVPAVPQQKSFSFVSI